MKYISAALLFVLLIFSSGIYAQSKFTGSWLGKLNVQGTTLRLIFKISENNGKLTAIMNSPDQTNRDIKVDSVSVDADTIHLFLKAVRGTYNGVYTNDTTITGKWNQGGMNFPIDLYKSDLSSLNDRPQNPKKPYPYKEEEVTFNNKPANVTLAGTFTYPEKGNNFPAVILITGSGQQDRDETVFRHKPFLVLSDYLTRNGIAVLRFDDRGAGKSTGDYKDATSLDFTGDVLAAIDYLKTRKEIDIKKIGLIGHSEGGIIAQIAAVKSKIPSFLVFMAGPGLSGKDVLLKQTELIMKSAGIDSTEIKRSLDVNKKAYEIAMTEKDSAAAYKKISDLMDQYFESQPDSIKKDPNYSKENLMKGSKTLLSPWVKYFLSYDPSVNLKQIKIPVLALNGELDTQVPANDDLAAINKYLTQAKNKNFKTIKFPGLNHLFQTCKTGSPSEYVTIDETIAPVVLQTISDWIKEQTKR